MGIVRSIVITTAIVAVAQALNPRSLLGILSSEKHIVTSYSYSEVQNILVAGVDSSTQSVKVVVRDAVTGCLHREGRAQHPDGTEVDPSDWWNALIKAIDEAGGLDDVSAISICGQQHGMITLDSDGYVIRPALLWNDVRSAGSAEALNAEYPDIATRSGSRLVAAFTASKIRWLVDHEPSNAARVASICLPHDWLSWKLLGDCKLESLVTDRSDASGTGYFNPITSKYDFDIFSKSIRSNRTIVLPRVLKGNEIAGEMPNGVKICAGGGDNAGAAFGLQAEPGDVIISLGTSGTAFAVSDTPTQDSVGEVAGFADLTGRYLPLVCTLNAARILDAATSILNCTYDDLAELALAAPPGANGLTLLPYFEGDIAGLLVCVK